MPQHIPHVRARWRLAAIVGAILAMFFVASPAFAAANDDSAEPDIRWSVAPADADGPDARTSIERTLDPGESVDDFIAVRNMSTENVTFDLTAADGFFTRTGRFDILPGDRDSVAAGTWITIADSVAVPAGQTVVVPFTMQVPEQAEPGDHAAGITASVLSVQSADDGTAVGVESRVGLKVLTRVTGQIISAAEVQEFVAEYIPSWNPFRPGQMTVEFDVVNDGNTRLVASGTVEAGGQSADYPAAGEIQQQLLPGDERTLTAAVDNVWPTFLIPTTVTLDAEVLTVDGATPEFQPVTAQVVVWAVPWPQLVLLSGAGLVVGALLWGRVRSRRRVSSLIEEARAAGRREASEGGSR
ncbi:hypothetical protein [Microbacterium sp. LWS13-1.2]|uniref:DUF916 domain-containing protein n=1 Tax=Microbacterium sp. LWS13-1.2 TaxID=3135264 RepID=A0AAU6SDZ5_9MICO